MTRLMVLGLLRSKSMTGYEIQQILHVSQTDLWAGILPGSIYHALKKMAKEELVALESVEQTGHRTKAFYQITEKGEQAFLEMLKESFKQTSVNLPTKLYTSLSFINNLANDEIVTGLTSHKFKLEEELAIFQSGIEQKKTHMNQADKIADLTFLNILQHYKQQIKFIEQLLDVYQNKS